MTKSKVDKPDVDAPPVADEQDAFKKSNLYQWTKISIVAIAIIVLVIGILGSMHWGIFSDFVMSDFVAFIDAYKGMFITLTGSIGLGGMAKNALKAKNAQKDDGRDIATGGEV